MIYAVQSTEGGPVKIGTTENLPARLAQLETHYGVSLAVLGTFDGGIAEEQAIHKRFAHLRFGRTEQFRPAPDLMAFLGQPVLVGVDPDAVEAMLPRGRDERTIKFDRGLASLAKAIARDRGVSLADYLSEVARPVVEADYLSLIVKLGQDAGLASA